MHVIYKPTGQTGTIPDDKFDPNLFTALDQSKEVQPIIQSTTQQQPQEDLSTKVGRVALNIGKSVAAPFVRTGKNIVGAAIQTPLISAENKARSEATNANLPETVREISGKGANVLEKTRQALASVGLTDKEFENLSNDKKKAVVQQIKDSINIGSYAVPFGKGSNFLTKATIPGAVVGGMQAASGENVTPEKVVGGAILGGAGSTALYGATQLPKILKGAGKATEKGGEALIQSQYNVPRSVAKDVNLPETVKQLSDYGISNINEVSQAAPLVTGENGVVTKLTRDAVGKAGPVDLSGMRQIATDLIADPSIPVGQDKKLLTTFIKTLDNIGDTTAINPQANPLDAFDAIKQLEKQAYSIGKRSVQLTQGDQAVRTAYLQMANELKDRLFSGAGADEQVVNVVAQSPILQKLAQKYPKVAEAIAGARTIGDLRAIAEPFVKGSIAGDITEFGQNLAIKNAGETVKGVGKMFQNPLNIIAVPLGTDAVNAGAGQAMRNIGKIPQNLPDIGFGNIAGQASARLPGVMNDQNNPANQPGQGPQNNQESQNAQGNSNHGDIIQPLSTGVNQQLPPITINGYTASEYLQGYGKALQAGDTAAAAKLKQLYDMTAAEEKRQKSLTGMGQMSTQGKIKYVNANISENLVNQIDAMYHAIPPTLTGARSGQMAGLLQRPGVALKTNKEAARYDAFIKANIEALARGISGQVGVMRKEEREAALEALPQLNDPTDLAEAKLQALKNQIAGVKQAASVDIGGIDLTQPDNTLPDITGGY